MRKCVIVALAILAILSSVLCDVYMHNPRGSNNRNCERNENRNNGARLFDSQNNGKGGYACPRAVGGPEVQTPRMYYYAGSTLPVEWTSQHSCGKTNNYCHIVLQYTCIEDLPGLRDGQPNDANDAATNTIDPNNANDPNVGQHETATYYQRCKTRYRQAGLYIADRQTENPGNLQRQSPATQTRQNPNGARSGLECPEERDYYPYWHPTPWRDIAVFTNDLTKCEFYRTQSQNVIDKGECFSAENTQQFLPYNNFFDCTKNNGKWVESGKWNLAPPDCLSTDLIATIDNHLGNKFDGKPATYNWKIPNIESEACVLRIRYNISTDDVPFDLDFKSNNDASPLKQDPFDKFGEYATYLSIAANTNQLGRTFQDRSYLFSIKKRPQGVPSDARIYNINVKGKRGNIVQTYPAVEYKFVPENLEVTSSDYIHFQWTGSDYNPARNPNDGEGGPKDPVDGQTRADRSNVVQLDYGGMSVPRPAEFNTMFVKSSNGKPDMNVINSLAFIGQDINTCLSWEDLLKKNNNNKDNAEKDSQNCAKLNAAKTPYYDNGLIRMYSTGTFHYFSSRNNNFSNRGQKGSIKVKGGKFSDSTRKMPSFILLFCLLVLFL